MQSNFKQCLESASLIIIAKRFGLPRKRIEEKWNYNVLTLKRSSKMKFMPNLHTFPGGVIEKTDSITDWLKLYESFGFKKEYFEKLATANQLPIYKTNDENALPRFLSLRISAIRETFEECGILICKNCRFQSEEQCNHWASFFGGHAAREWQKKVHKDSKQLLDMCYKFNIYPDVCALHEWSNWVTPYTMSRRFDTIFFLTAFENVPPSMAEKNEVQHLQWATPYEFLKWNNDKDIMLAPPQVYEISRLINFNDAEKLINFAQARSQNGCERYLPYRISSSGKEITILPGDDMYPSEEKLQENKMMSVDFVPESKIMHRIIHTETYKNYIILSNFTPKYEHVLPVTHILQQNKL